MLLLCSKWSSHCTQIKRRSSYSVIETLVLTCSSPPSDLPAVSRTSQVHSCLKILPWAFLLPRPCFPQISALTASQGLPNSHLIREASLNQKGCMYYQFVCSASKQKAIKLSSHCTKWKHLLGHERYKKNHTLRQQCDKKISRQKIKVLGTCLWEEEIKG